MGEKRLSRLEQHAWSSRTERGKVEVIRVTFDTSFRRLLSTKAPRAFQHRGDRMGPEKRPPNPPFEWQNYKAKIAAAGAAMRAVRALQPTRRMLG